MNKIGILGGTFDPIHNGHMYMARVAVEQLGLDRVIIIPTGKVPHKDNENITDSHHRYNMAILAADEFENYTVSDTEIKRDGISYTFETLGELKKQYKDDEFYFIVGADSFCSIDHWRNPAEIFKLATLAVVGRNEDTCSDMNEFKEHIEKKYNGTVKLLAAHGPDISSTKLRELLVQGESVDGMIPKAVKDYICEHKLYTEL